MVPVHQTLTNCVWNELVELNGDRCDLNSSIAEGHRTAGGSGPSDDLQPIRWERVHDCDSIPVGGHISNDTLLYLGCKRKKTKELRNEPKVLRSRARQAWLHEVRAPHLPAIRRAFAMSLLERPRFFSLLDLD